MENDMINTPYPTWTEIRLSAIEHNLHQIQAEAGVSVMAMVKANGYGHGAVQVSRAALHAGAVWLGVARFSEAMVLREAGITAPILLMGMIMPGEIEQAIAERVTLNVYSYESADLLRTRAREIGKPVAAHLKIDTGMGRLGVFPEEAVGLAQYAVEGGWVHLDGLFSHFAMADIYGNDLTHVQIERFKTALNSLNEAGIQPRWVHLSNSAGALTVPDARFNLVRPGTAMYGIWPSAGAPNAGGLEPALAWKASLASSKALPAGWGVSYGQEYHLDQDEIIGVLPVGYADGFRRMPGNEVLIGGRRQPIRGRVCMDLCMLHLPEAMPMGAEIVIIGQQDKESIRAEEVGSRWKTGAIDVTSTIAARVPRIYVD
jgi:alanine racemase